MGSHSAYWGENRRGSGDRRIEDAGPPTGWRDRRKLVERRFPVVEENTVSHTDWWEQYDAFVARINAYKAKAESGDASKAPPKRGVIGEGPF